MKTCILFIFLFASAPAIAQRLVLQGPNPDPSIQKIGDTYWSSVTSSNWFPAFPILSSTDLVNWKQHGYVFYEKPAWVERYFWAPEIYSDSTKTYIFYTAKKVNGPLCVAVASADNPGGPYTDHGPLVCQQNGSIDAFVMTDSTNVPYLVWKEDGNSVNQPTIIWAQSFDSNYTSLKGEPKELFRNDAPWEHDLVEGVSMIRHGEYVYAFYAAAGCCGSGCSYVTGVARAKSLLGTWKKYNKNPVLVDDSTWICKGHGTPVVKDDRYYFLYHGYHRATSAFTGREALLQEFVFTEDGWIEFLPGNHNPIVRKEMIRHEFEGDTLPKAWQWNVFQKVRTEVSNGSLTLFAAPSRTGNFIGHTIATADYTATTSIATSASTALAGIGAIGDHRNMMALLVKDFTVHFLQVKNGVDSVAEIIKLPIVENVYLRMSVEQPYRVTFSYSTDGEHFFQVNKEPLRGTYLAPWDNAPRAGLIAKGTTSEVGVFNWFEVRGGILKSPELSEEVQQPNWGKWSAIIASIVVVCVGVFLFARHKRKYDNKP